MVLEKVNNGHVVKFNSPEPRYYKKVDGKIYFSESNDNNSNWKKSSAKDSAFSDDSKWTVLE